MERPTINATQAVFQAGGTIGTYLAQAIDAIDRHLGKGYAAEHPELIAECVRSQTLDFNNCALISAIYAMNDSIETAAASISDPDVPTAIDAVSDSIEEVSRAIRDGQ